MSDGIDIQWTRINRMACGKCGTHLDVSSLAPFAVIECPSCKTKQTVPVQLGTFLLVEQLGAGGMGAVYRAMDSTLGRFVAIKVMKSDLGADPALVESFLREARAAAALNHPNIVTIFSCGQELGQPYIVMELVSGGRLDQMMAGGKAVDELRLLEISLDVAEGLKAANEAGLVHGDIKPANVLFDKSGRARIVDFGLAMFVNRQQEQGGVWGTPYYISPERARGGKADHRSDIYSLGATMFHALAGKPPFDGKTAADVVVARLKRPPPKLNELVPSLQPATCEVIERMMAADPVHRYPTSASLLADIRKAIAQVKDARSPAGRAKKGGKGKKRDLTRVYIFAGAALLLVALAVALIVSMASPEEEAAPAAPVAPAVTETGAVAVAVATQDLERAVATVKEGGRDRQSVTFFPVEQEEELVRIGALLADKPAELLERLSSLATNVPADSARRQWLDLLQAPPHWMQGNSVRAAELIRELAAKETASTNRHPSEMPVMLARHLNGDLNAAQFGQIRNQWAAWYTDLAECFRGTRLLAGGDTDAALEALARYARSPRKEPVWAYALRPAATAWVEQLQRWEAERRKVLGLASVRNMGDARAAIDAYLLQAPPYIRPAAEQIRNRIRDTLAREDAVRIRQEEQARAVVIQRDLDTLDAWLGEQLQVVLQQKDYRKVALDARRVAGDLQTAEGKEQANIVRERLERMDALKTLLARELESTPFRQQDRELGGDAIGATIIGLRIMVPGRGITTRPWEQVSPRIIVRLVRHLLDNGFRDDSAKADLLVSLAVFSAFYGAAEPAAQFLAEATALDMAIGAAARRMMPENYPAPAKPEDA